MRAIDLFPHRNDFRPALFPALRQLTPEQLDWAPPGSKNAISVYLRHVAQSEDWFINRVIGFGPFAPRRKADLPDIDSMIAYLEATRANTERYLSGRTVAELVQETRLLPAQEFRGGARAGEDTLLWIIHRLFSHEIYHFAQILLVMRLQGIDPPNV